MPDLHDLTALHQAAAIRAGEFTCQDLTRHYLERTDALDAKVGAFITVAADEAMAQAAEVDERVGAGEEQPLMGCIAPVKDLDLVAGLRCTFGSLLMQDFVAPVDASFVTRMRAGGLIITGKTNTPEFGLPCYTENELAPAARTPWDLSRSAGGSSGGAATAVASGLASLAQGSDGGGSIRIPASVTGLVGIKTSRGRISQAPMIEGVGELGVIGPLARTVTDAAAFLDLLAHSSPGDPFALSSTPGQFLHAAHDHPQHLRVARFARPILVDTDVAPECLTAYELAGDLLRELGHDVIDIDRPYGPEVVPAFETVWAAGAASIPVPPESEHLLLPLTRYLRERGTAHTAADLMNAVTVMRIASRSAIESTSTYDAVLTPTLAQLPSPVGELRRDDDPAADFEDQKAFTPFTSPFNVSGQPAISIPMHHTDAGLPVGVQLIGRPRDEVTIIGLAAQVEAVLAWHERRHDLW